MNAGVIRVLACLVTVPALWSQNKLADDPLEQLLNIQVTSVNKKAQDLSKTAAAVFVISRDDIRRSGATSIPELLRLAPGVDVSRVNSSNWAVGIRGYNALYSDKLLVLVDGRSVYSSMFSGVFWDQLDLPLQEIERIEVIRGPGASVWGANAANGVINIITRSSETGRGGTAGIAASSAEDSADISYGGDAGAHGHYRAYARTSFASGAPLGPGDPPADSLHGVHGGFRSDWRLSGQDTLVVEGDVFEHRGGDTVEDALIPTPIVHSYRQPTEDNGGSLLGRWSHTGSAGSEQSFQVSYQAFHRLQLELPIGERALDLEYQNRRHIGARHDVIWGLGYRITDTHLNSNDWIRFTPAHRSDPLYSAFLQDEIQIAPKLSLIAGARFEHNAYTGFKWEPSLRLAWMPSAATTLWASASTADREPNRWETSVAIDLGWVPIGPQQAALTVAFGNPKLCTERVRDFAIGYRRRVGNTISLDATSFLSFYRDLSTTDTGPPQLMVAASGPYLEIPEVIRKRARAMDFGGEVAVTWNVNGRWRLSPSYSLLRMNAHVIPGSTDILAFNTYDSPEHMFRARSLIDLPGRFSFDQTLSWTSALGAPIPANWRLDLRLARRLGELAEFSIVGQNLFRPGTLEFSDTYGLVATDLQRSIYGRIAWTF